MKFLANKTNVLIVGVFTLIIVAPILISLFADSSDVPEVFHEDEIKVQKLERVNIFFENSESMWAYEGGDPNDFRQDLNSFMALIDFEHVDWNFYVVNDSVYSLPNLTRRELMNANRIYGDHTRRQGNTTITNFDLIFTHLLDSTGSNELSILISDMLYDTPKTLHVSAEEACRDFRSISNYLFAKRSNEISLMQIKMKSHYHGNYFPNFRNNPMRFPINQQRPYYIMVYGQPEMINLLVSHPTFRSSQVLRERLKGFRDYLVLSRFTDNPPDIYYSAFAYSLPNSPFAWPKSAFADKEGIHTLLFKNRKHFSRQLLVGADFSNLPVLDEYVMDIANYDVDTSKFKILSIEPFHDDMLTNRLDRERIGNVNFVYTIELAKLQAVEIEIKLKNELPAWVSGSSNYTDGINRIVSTSQTVGLTDFMGGILDAYRPVGSNPYIFNLSLKIIP